MIVCGVFFYVYLIYIRNSLNRRNSVYKPYT